MLEFISIRKRHHMWVGVPNVLKGLRLKSIRKALIAGFSRWLNINDYDNLKNCLKGKVL